MIRFRIFICITTLTLFFSCRKNDFIVQANRAGELKLGMKSATVINKLSAFDIKTFTHGTFNSQQYLIIKDGDKELYHLYFYRDRLKGMKVYDDKFQTKEGLKINMTAGEVVKKGLYFSFVNFDYDEGLACKIGYTNIFGKRKELSDIEFYFTRSIYKSGMMLDIGKSAKLIFFHIGDRFNIKEDILTSNEKEQIRELREGFFENGAYINNYYNITLPIPDNWERELYDIVELRSKESKATLGLHVQTNTLARDGKKFLDDLGFPGEIRLFDQKEEYAIYKKTQISDKEDEHRVYYSVTVNSNNFYFVGKHCSVNDLYQIDDIVRSLELN